MRGWGTLAAELRKAVALPAALAGIAVALVASVLVTGLNAYSTRTALGAGDPVLSSSPFDTALAAMPLGTVGAIVLGVVVVSSEYTANSTDAGGGRQISTTLAATPRRTHLLFAKIITVILLVVGVAVVSVGLSVAVAYAILAGSTGIDAADQVPLTDPLIHALGGTLYWAITGLIALAVTVLFRSGIVPLVVLIMNNSVVSLSLLLTKLTPLAHWLPDMAGRRLYGDLGTVDGGLEAGPGALVMAGWAVLLLVVAGVVFHRRDV